MYVLTQGTVITGMRSKKYKDASCFGIIVSARCDLANCKVSKIYYLTAISVDDWLLSDEGFKEVLSTKVSSLESNLQSKLEEVELDWNTLKYFTLDEFKKVVNDPEVGPIKDVKKYVDTFWLYRKYISDLTTQEKIEILKEQKKSVTEYLQKIANGTIMHYAYIPQKAYIDNFCPYSGLIIDLQELEYISLKVAEVLSKCEMDIQSRDLSEKDIENYNVQFFLKESPGYALPEFNIQSPWIEYLMQRFSNAFIRIGVDGPQKEHIQKMIDRVCKII